MSSKALFRITMTVCWLTAWEGTGGDGPTGRARADEPRAAARRIAALKAKIDETYLAWYGPTTKGSAAYYRIQGPTLLIEYAPQGGTNHIHTIIRDPTNDYGKEWTKP